MFCGARLLRIRWETARAFASTEAQRAICQKVLARYIEEMRGVVKQLRDEGRVAEATDKEIIIQRNGDGYYAGPLIHERFQVMESLAPRDTYYLVDHFLLPDTMVRVNGPASDIRRFASKLDAETHAAYIVNQLPVPASGAGQPKKGYTTMAKSAAKPAATPLPKAAKEKAIVAAAASAGGKIAAAAKSGEAKAPRETASSMLRDLIMEGKHTDAEIFAKVQARYGLSDDKKWYPSWYRIDLKKKGKNPPGPIGAPLKADPKPKKGAAAPPPPAPAKKTAAKGKAPAPAASGRKPGRSKAA